MKMFDSIGSLLNSASKIVFILIAITLCGAFLYEVMAGRIVLESKEFMVLAAMAFTYYFTYKPSEVKPQSSNLPIEAVK